MTVVTLGTLDEKLVFVWLYSTLEIGRFSWRVLLQ